jgi:hypothetical protein
MEKRPPMLSEAELEPGKRYVNRQSLPVHANVAGVSREPHARRPQAVTFNA